MKKIMMIALMLFSISALAEIDDSLYKNINLDNENNSYTDLIEPLANLIGTTTVCNENTVKVSKENEDNDSCIEKIIGNQELVESNRYKYDINSYFNGVTIFHKSDKENVTKNFVIEIKYAKNIIYDVTIRAAYSFKPASIEMLKQEVHGHSVFFEKYLDLNQWKKTNRIGYIFSGHSIYQKGNIELETWAAVGYPLIIKIKRLDLPLLNEELKSMQERAEIIRAENKKEREERKFQ